MSSSRSRNNTDDILLTRNSKMDIGDRHHKNNTNKSHTLDPYGSDYHKHNDTFGTISPPRSHSNNDSLDKPKYGTIYVYCCTALACLSSILLGYDIGKFV